jgi:small-conductance mechanosensitive channel
MELLYNTFFLLFLTILLTLTVYPYTWLKVCLSILSTIYGWFLWYTGQYLFLLSLFFIETFLLYNLLKTVFHLV